VNLCQTSYNWFTHSSILLLATPVPWVLRTTNGISVSTVGVYIFRDLTLLVLFFSLVTDYHFKMSEKQICFHCIQFQLLFYFCCNLIAIICWSVHTSEKKTKTKTKNVHQLTGGNHSSVGESLISHWGCCSMGQCYNWMPLIKQTQRLLDKHMHTASNMRCLSSNAK